MNNDPENTNMALNHDQMICYLSISFVLSPDQAMSVIRESFTQQVQSLIQSMVTEALQDWQRQIANSTSHFLDQDREQPKLKHNGITNSK